MVDKEVVEYDNDRKDMEGMGEWRVKRERKVWLYTSPLIVKRRVPAPEQWLCGWRDARCERLQIRTRRGGSMSASEHPALGISLQYSNIDRCAANSA